MKINTIKKQFSNLSFAIVGGGPGGFFTAKHILKKYPEAIIDVYEKMPHPYGLVRTGVAPDHQDVKNVEKDFAQLMIEKKIRFLGNVTVGKDIQLKDLHQNYSGLILSYGADSENELNLPNENKIGSFSARNFVNWYNGHLYYFNQSQFNQVDFSRIQDVVIIGNGNVAIDVARILSKSVEELQKYDIPESILEKLSKSRIKNIHIVARRGVVQGAFTVKELRELSRVKGVNMNVFTKEVEYSFNINSEEEMNAITPQERRHFTRKIELIKTFNFIDRVENIKTSDKNSKNIFLRFLLSPYQINVDDKDKVENIIFKRSHLEGTPYHQVSVKDEELVKLSTSLIFKSIGYKSVPLFNEISFDSKNNVIKHSDGICYDRDGNLISDVFTVGWVKRGAKGIIDSTLRDSYNTAESIFAAIVNDKLKYRTPDYNGIVQSIKNKNIFTFSWEDWKKVEDYELEEGIKNNKIREKLMSLEKMIEIAKK